ncbi:MAG: heparinase II/III family protein [Gemmatimonadaceae bacterium]|nr:heparinase II/III family protein [Gemmatimonadaceae bacterium]
MILLNSRDLGARRSVAAGALSPLAASLHADMERVLREAPAISGQKAMLTRDGGRCPTDGAPLDFDPYSPHAHRCPTCDQIQTGERHHRWWLMFAQLWRAERAVHAATLHALGDEPRLAAFARATLDEYADRYGRYPLDDNILGPSRPFFSTYLESIWLLQLCIAADLLDAAGAGESCTARFRERVAVPSAALIRSYDEGESNRQLWNNAALIAAGLSLGDDAVVAHAVDSRSGLVAQLGAGLLEDGSWYEGENYHLFSHRALWYGVTMAEQAGYTLPSPLLARFQAGFSTPFLTAFPDLTFPARRDSQFGATLRQWRTAESCELGLARADDDRLTAALAALYADDIPQRDTGRWRSAAESERNEPASALTRSDLGWRSLLFARESLPMLGRAPMQSALLEGQGIAVFRRDRAKAYVALDYGHHGGGHGHPDRLNVLLAHGSRRILDDMGTGSYVDRSLHWYRSTLAHNAPLVNGRSQPRTDGYLVAYDERGDLGWVQARSRISDEPPVEATRALTVTDAYVIDELRWSTTHVVRIELPFHARVRLESGTPLDWTRAQLDGGDGLEDGFAFASDARFTSIAANTVVRMVDEDSAATLAWTTSTGAAEWWSAMAPGHPGAGTQRFLILRMYGSEGRVRTVWNRGSAVSSVVIADQQLRVNQRGGVVTTYEWRDDGAFIARFDGPIESATLLTGFHERENSEHDAAELAPPPATRLYPLPFSRDLAEPEYRASEYLWSNADTPRARVDIDADHFELEIRVDVHKSPLCFREAGAPDPALDNESADINSDGVQLHLWCEGWREPASWLAVPERDFSSTRVRRIAGGDDAPPITAESRETNGGYELRFTIPRSSLHANDVSLDILINDMISTRQRRRGQLVLSGAHGDRVYLRGDRQPLASFLRLRLPS